MGPLDIHWLVRMIQPFCWKRADTQRVGKDPNCEAKGQNQYCIKNGKKDACLEVTDLATDPLPPLPEALEKACLGQGRTPLSRLEQCVNEWSDRRTLSH
jgi:hypothetical protein